MGATTPRAEERTVRRRLSREERSAELMAAAEAIVMADGPPGLTLERLAEEAGCSRNLAYTYFPNMSALLDAMRERQRTRLRTTALERVPREGPFDEWLAAWVGVILDEASDRGPLFLMLFDARSEERQAMSLGTVAGFETRLRADRGLEPDRARVVARLITGAVLAAVGAVAVDGMPRSLVDAELHGLIRHLV